MNTWDHSKHRIICRTQYFSYQKFIPTSHQWASILTLYIGKSNYKCWQCWTYYKMPAMASKILVLDQKIQWSSYLIKYTVKRLLSPLLSVVFNFMRDYWLIEIISQLNINQEEKLNNIPNIAQYLFNIEYIIVLNNKLPDDVPSWDNI